MFLFCLVFAVSLHHYLLCKPVLSGHTRRPKIGFPDKLSLSKVLSIAECFKGSILQYF